MENLPPCSSTLRKHLHDAGIHTVIVLANLEFEELTQVVLGADAQELNDLWAMACSMENKAVKSYKMARR